MLRSAGTISASVSWYLDQTVAVFYEKKRSGDFFPTQNRKWLLGPNDIFACLQDAEQPSPKKEEEMFQADEDGKGPKIKTEEQRGVELFQAQHSLS